MATVTGSDDADPVSSAGVVVVAAMDFGTTYSGYAFSLVSAEDNKEAIQCNQTWSAGTQALISLKAPTSILLKPDKTFHSFGFEAEDKYGNLADDDEHHNWFFFRRFKMFLHGKQNLSSTDTLEDITGKKRLPAVDIFAHGIRFMKTHLMMTLNNQYEMIREREVAYVITVPAIWDEKAKQFMILAAGKAGISRQRLQLALEPEAASIWCQLETETFRSRLSATGTKYMVVDLGGGTADITAHEKLADGTLRELSKASGGAWGGNEVDKRFLAFLEDIIGKDAMTNFKSDETSDYFDVLRGFEVKKRKITTEPGDRVTFSPPASLIRLGQFDKAIPKSKYKNSVVFEANKLRVDKKVMEGFFDDSVTKLIDHLKGLFQQPKLQDITFILLVGGYAESKLIQGRIEKAFPGKRLIVPDDPGLAVMKGAVRFGRKPELISTRVARFTFGREAWPEFDPKQHDSKRKTTVRNKKVCRGVFRTMVALGEDIPVGRSVKVTSKPISVDSQSGTVNVYCSTQPNPRYIDEPGCNPLGNVTAELPAASSLEDKEFDIEFKFGGTTIDVNVTVRKTRKKYNTSIKCL